MNTRSLAVASLVLCVGSVASAQNWRGQFDFTNADLSPSFGVHTAEFYDDLVDGGTAGSTQADTTFGTVASFSLPTLPGGDSGVVLVPAYFGNQMIRVRLDAPVNGGGDYVNQYTMIYDILVPQSTFDAYQWFPFFNTNCCNDNDADAYIQYNVGIGINGEYAGVIAPNTWHRVAFVFDLTQPDGQPDMFKYIDGVLVASQEVGSVDGRFATYSKQDNDPEAFDSIDLFSEPEGLYTSPAYISSFAFVDRALTETDLALLGGADANGIFCPADVDENVGVDLGDFFAFFGYFDVADPRGDVDGIPGVDLGDFFAFFSGYDAGC